LILCGNAIPKTIQKKPLDISVQCGILTKQNKGIL